MIAYKSILATSSIVFLMGCISAAPQEHGYAGADAATLIAGEHSAMNTVAGNSTTIRILDVDGVPTGAGRFNAGSIRVSPGARNISVRLWGSPRGYGAAGAEAFACIKINAIARTTYILSGSVMDKDYMLSVYDKSGISAAPVLQVAVNFTQKLPAGGCIQAEGTRT